RRLLLIPRAEPLNESVDFDIAPHPRRKAPERRLDTRPWRPMPHMAIDDSGVRPIGLRRNDGETVPLDQAPRDRGARAIELRGAVACFAQHHHASLRKA